MDLLFSLAEIKFIQSNHGVFKNLPSTNQNRAFILTKFLVFSDTNQSESSFNGHGNFNKVLCQPIKTEFYFSWVFSTILISFVDIKDFFTGRICGSDQSELSIHRF